MVDPDECSPEEFAEAIGHAIISWQDVEAQSAGLFSHLLGAKGIGASAVFYHIKNNSTRIEMMNIAARFRFHFPHRQKMLAEWKALSQRLLEASSLRNKIAHFEIDEEMTETGWKFTLTPSVFDWSQLDPQNIQKWKQRQQARIVTYTKIKSAEASFARLAKDLSTFSERVVAILLDPELDRDDGPMPPNAQESG